jgi:hypothetical protein
MFFRRVPSSVHAFWSNGHFRQIAPPAQSKTSSHVLPYFLLILEHVFTTRECASALQAFRLFDG